MNIRLKTLVGILSESASEGGSSVIENLEFRGGSIVGNGEGGGTGESISTPERETRIWGGGADAEITG